MVHQLGRGLSLRGFGGFFLIMAVFAETIWYRYHVDIFGDVTAKVILLGWWFLYYFILKLFFCSSKGTIIHF